MIKCKGCGAEIQFSNPSIKGYINKTTYDKRIANNQEILCERCFRLKNYNEDVKIEIDEDAFLDLVKTNVKEGMLICNIVDAFDLDGTMIDNINKLFPDNPILIIANKYDLFMRSNRPTKIKKYVAHYLEQRQIKNVGVIVTSGKEEFSSQKVYETLLKIIRANNLKKEVFLFGMSNVGKTTMLNSMIKTINKNNDLLTVSSAVSTTLAISSLQIGEITIYDTPGIINKKQATYYLNKKTIDMVMPKNFVKPIVYQLNSQQTIFIEGFGSVSYLSKIEDSFERKDCDKIYNSNKLSIICYFSRNIYLHRTNYQNKEPFYNKHKDDIFKFPNKGERKKLGKLVKYKFEIDDFKEISFSGLGFVGFNGKGIIEVETFENILVKCRGKLI